MTLRYMHSDFKKNREFKEIEFKVPWGKISGKLWGPENVPPILAIHGWQDNAGSFDPLAEYLPENISLLAIDLPGHGYSSWIPKGMPYSPIIYLQTIERVKKYYGMDKIGLIGHSLGEGLIFSYTSLYPKNVKFVVAFDYFKDPSFNPAAHTSHYTKSFDESFKMENWSDDKLPPSYTETDAISRWIASTNKSLNFDTCKILMQRGATKIHDDNEYVYFLRDPRIQLFLTNTEFSHEQLRHMGTRITCPYMAIKSENSGYSKKK
ncbi:hypothetical protein HCN44_001510 [Aphidius gifuensis]|uniref:AB hydrolase-1 domain-containing protein n=1 Tax=Aphidius gifuensis TaxID=684658 RepID=A0A834XUB0_APHGI|nr:probable serine hydrolase [Aphidius gifuensis]KAF7992185.1 hypothetical protein HCN44_001510 [Aphidius gifuensis]